MKLSFYKHGLSEAELLANEHSAFIAMDGKVYICGPSTGYAYVELELDHYEIQDSNGLPVKESRNI